VAEVRAFMWREGTRWKGRVEGRDGLISAASQRACMDKLRAMAGSRATLTVQVMPPLPALVGVAEAAQILGWDKRRVFTYISRGQFPEPVAMLASGRVWRREDVEAFAREKRKRRPWSKR
jgi:predicted DNA-binding transcriptional regulator AlpA